ncbi:MAG: TMEM165/GDT1 family protein [Methylococcales bacterium]|nr:TMEM165/GDT1 family protein [Methylococcales bacterium]
MNFFQSYIQNTFDFLSSINAIDFSTTATTSFLLIVVAEIGDKSQLVCMALATRYRATPVILGAISAFIFLNGLAVIFGSTIAHWFPDWAISATVALLFTLFGLHSLFFSATEQEDEEIINKKTSHNIFFTTFLLITLAEFADKTQLAVVALSSAALPIAVWLGATCALILTTLLGVIAGKKILQKCHASVLHKISGGFFLILATIAIYNAYLNYQPIIFSK